MFGEPQSARFAAQNLNELGMNDFDDLLRRVQRTGYLRRQSAFLHSGTESPHDRKRDVSFEQSSTNLADGSVDVSFGQSPLASKILECRG
jgi:hypothetical protein